MSIDLESAKLRIKQIAKKLFKLTFYVLFLFITVLCLFELTYRYQLVDYYSNEWEHQNENLTEQEQEGERVLVFGDSFTADPNSWVNALRKDSTQSKVYFNASLPGVGVETHRLLQGIRQNEVNPDIVIVQLYIGNDLLDIKKPVNWSAYSFSRNTFWTFSNRFRGLNFINYRMGQVSQDVVNYTDPKSDKKFSVKSYSERTKLFIKGDGNYPNNVIEISTSKKDEFESLLTMLNEMRDAIPRESEFYVLVIPHCSQISEKYVNNYRELGAKIDFNILKKNSWVEALKKEKFNIIDPLKTFRKLEIDSLKLYYENDPHLNEIGQSELAKIVKSAVI